MVDIYRPKYFNDVVNFVSTNLDDDFYFTKDNIWVKRPGTGEIKAKDYYRVINKKARRSIKKDNQLKWGMIDYEKK